MCGLMIERLKHWAQDPSTGQLAGSSAAMVRPRPREKVAPDMIMIQEEMKGKKESEGQERKQQKHM